MIWSIRLDHENHLKAESELPIIEGDENISDVDEDELSLHSSRLESEGSAIASTLHSESDSDLDRKSPGIIIICSDRSVPLKIMFLGKNRSDRYSSEYSNRLKITLRNTDPGCRHL